VDIDGDGDVDAITNTGMFENSGTGVFERRTATDVEPSIGFFPRGDLNGDGVEDLVRLGLHTRPRQAGPRP